MYETEKDLQKTAVIKTLAIIGFIVALIFVAWLAVQAVRLVPEAFKTLASIASGLKHSKDSDFTISTGANTINTGETLNISWTKPSQNGTYTFSYKCTDGVAAEMRASTGELTNVACDNAVPLTKYSESAAVIFSSEKGRFVDVHYTIAFTPDGTALANERTGVITVVNPGINAQNPAPTTSTTSTVVTTNTTSMPLATTTNTTSTTTNAAPTTTPWPTHTPATTTTPVTKPKPLFKTVPVVVTRMPVSNPNGFADLAVTFIGVGTYNPNTNTFNPQTALTGSAAAALRFEVKNIGTKTSGDWQFSATLPTDPTFTYNSPVEAGLKPNERQVITLQFTAASSGSSVQTTVAVTGGNDLITSNNFFSRQITISN